jgi:uncharacterized protein
MTIAFADSNFYVALLIARDANHAKAKAIAQPWTGDIVTSEYVLTEVADHLGGSAVGRAKFGQFLADVKRDPQTSIVESSHGPWERGVDLYLRRGDKAWSLTDCISFVIMDERALVDALTTDRHFEQAGFGALLRV